jgi:hypothetical protein
MARVERRLEDAEDSIAAALDRDRATIWRRASRS